MGVVIVEEEGAVLGVNLGCFIVTNGDFVAYSYARVTRCSQMTLGELVYTAMGVRNGFQIVHK